MLQFGNNHLQTFLQVLYAMTVETLENHRISLKKHPDHKTFFNSQIKTNISYIYIMSVSIGGIYCISGVCGKSVVYIGHVPLVCR